MSVSLPIVRPSVRNGVLVVAICLGLLGITTVVLWSVLAPDPDLIAPTRWIEAARNIA